VSARAEGKEDREKVSTRVLVRGRLSPFPGEETHTRYGRGVLSCCFPFLLLFAGAPFHSPRTHPSPLARPVLLPPLPPVKEPTALAPLGLGFIAATDTCASTCAIAGKKPATFHPFRADAGRAPGAPPLSPAAACSAVRADGTRAAGWQGVGGEAVCNIVDGSAAVRASEYACLCLDGGEVQGLERARGGAGGCSSACAASITGAPGHAIAVGTGDHACLALSEQGLGNRFGTEVAGGACLTARGGVALASDSYSCVCAFAEGAAAAVQPTVETQSIRTTP